MVWCVTVTRCGSENHGGIQGNQHASVRVSTSTRAASNGVSLAVTGGTKGRSTFRPHIIANSLRNDDVFERERRYESILSRTLYEIKQPTILDLMACTSSAPTMHWPSMCGTRVLSFHHFPLVPCAPCDGPQRRKMRGATENNPIFGGERGDSEPSCRFARQSGGMRRSATRDTI
jgi:hypothetical protein